MARKRGQLGAERPLNYILRSDHTARPAWSVVEWVSWWEASRHDGSSIVGRDEIGHALVSTVFLGIDHGFNPDDEPILFETMIFDERRESWESAEDFMRHHATQFQLRYETWDEAERGHKVIVAVLRSRQLALPAPKR